MEMSVRIEPYVTDFRLNVTERKETLDTKVAANQDRVSKE